MISFAAPLPEMGDDLMAFVNALCDRIEAVEPYIHALLPEEGRRARLLADAARLLSTYPNAGVRPPLFGVPVGVKDLYHVAGFKTRAGSRLPPEPLTGAEGPVVRRLKDAGALIIGKTVTTEFAYFSPGPTCNPHNITHTPGGSSSGSAAAVAAGECALALGTQTIGSVSRPAAYCGVFGFKPSFGRMSVQGVIPFSPRVDQMGYFAPDMAGILGAAPVMCDKWNTETPLPAVRPLVLGVPQGKYMAQADDTVLAFFKAQCERLSDLGHKLIPCDPFPDITRINAIHRTLNALDLAKVHAAWFAKYEALYSPQTRALILEGQTADDTGADQSIAGLRARMDGMMESLGLDLWLAPATTTPAPEGLSATGSPLMNLPFTHAGIPTLAVPAGKTTSGLPLGLQLAGCFGRDEDFLSLAASLA
ncbi:MAG TPA: amidase [Rhodospirillaceae bacterium]|nr:MAG: hypothetical protein A2018_03440 [Alphaproteobacteria bacterium GWF2_58_20]HAU29621.1 amidase [Rhodospirillaceae bacterium]